MTAPTAQTIKTEAAEKHVIFGTGPAGLALTDYLVGHNKQVMVVNRSGRASVPEGVEVRAADATDPAAVTALCHSAVAVYHCANVPYTEQYEIIPKLQAALFAGAGAAGAKLIVTDTLYSYGETHGTPITEDMPLAATTHKGRLRADAVVKYLDAHQAGTVRAALGCAADFFGPRVFNSSFGEQVFPPVLNKYPAPAHTLGDITIPHSYSYIKDVARGLATLGENEAALGKSWLLPVAPAVTTRDMINLLERALGHPVSVQPLPQHYIETIGTLDPQIAELVELFYQYEEPQIVDSRRFEETFGWHATPLLEAMQETVAWFQEQEKESNA